MELKQALKETEIHVVTNGICEICGLAEKSIDHDLLCNAHTHGLEKFGHMNFQMVLNYDHQEIGRILNTMSERVIEGERFADGDMVSGIYEDCDVRLKEFFETDRTVLRVIIPDKENRFPEDAECEEPYKYQLLETDDL